MLLFGKTVFGVSMDIFKPGVWEKFHQILKKDGILYLPIGGYGTSFLMKYKNIYGLFNYLGEKTLNLIDTRVVRNKTNPRAESRNTWHVFKKCTSGTYSTVGASSCLLDSETSAKRRWDRLDPDAKEKNMWKFRKKDQTHKNYVKQIKTALDDKRKKQTIEKSTAGGKNEKPREKGSTERTKQKRNGEKELDTEKEGNAKNRGRAPVVIYIEIPPMLHFEARCVLWRSTDILLGLSFTCFITLHLLLCQN